MSTTEFHNRFDGVANTLQSFAYSLTTDVENARDLFQETALRAFSNKEKFRVGTNFKAWVMTMMKNIFINNYRMRKRRKTSNEPTGSYVLDTGKGNTNNSGISNLTMTEIMKLLSEMDDQYSVPFLRYFDGYSYQEIADDLDKPLGTIKSRIHHARKMLQKELKNKYNIEKGLYA